MSVSLPPAEADLQAELDRLLDRLTTYYPRAIDPNLDRTVRLLRDLGDPHTKMPPAIHIAGTNGKGSTLAAMRAVLEAAGMSCHVMTSPHLVRFNERLVLGGAAIETAPLIALLEEVDRVNVGQETTSFELTTAAGFLAFARHPADLCLVETGMGGRLDATNVMQAPLASVITVISYDHMQFLGSTLPLIAAEKAAIMKPGVPAVIGPQTSEGIAAGLPELFADHAAATGAPLYRHGAEWSFDPLKDGFVLHTASDSYDFPRPNLVGAHQIGNAATAAMTLLTIEDRLPKPLTPESLSRGLTHIHWPGRLQRLSAGELPALLPPGLELWLDGGHNDTGGMVLGAQAAAWAAADGRKLSLVLGMLNTKDPRAFIAPLRPHAASVHTLTIPGQPLSLAADDLAALTGGTPAASAAEAIRAIVAAGPPGRILITGSLYLAGEILKTSS